MEFNDFTFIFLFLPLYILCFYLFKRNKLVTLLFSGLFYFLSDIKYLFLLVLVIFFTWIVGLKVKENKKLYGFYVIVMLGLLLGFKYFNLIVKLLKVTSAIQLMLPVGISYYLFEAFSYVSDCYRGKYDAEKNLVNVALYVSFFPTIISGPIIRYDSFHEFLERNDGNMEDIGKGLRRFMIGVIKKIVVANQLVYVCNLTFSDSVDLSQGLAWVGLIAFALRLYYDFSGCSDMAIGVGRMIGYVMPENFDDPYSSKSVAEFYRRWHKTLGSWFKDYIYIPMGGNRVSTFRWIINTMTVWIFTGVWHGATLNYILWGAFLGVYIILERKIISKIPLPSFVRWALTTFVILLSWLVFNTATLDSFVNYMTVLFNGKETDLAYIRTLGLTYITPVYLVALLMLVPSVKKLIFKLEWYLPVLYDLLVLALFVAAIFLMVTSSQASSVYFGF